ncbi:hypothetical protein Ocepr_1973 [Oceanithermus profundus DSM 14977]|uniref:Uncharacterized protein n=1 Tax=Oceanithermus profundus (strain DSM 14977 / NBRC 100410 / VKM B-2274 / 506) TaxID=670487 RepID=E4UA47_OCEP5|nr:hypothetical protein [Oceanithermus profundus]ADR37424.1 hypothetical protein Ocepr_1973 [Oceanithermus profundus DSM 14977]
MLTHLRYRVRFAAFVLGVMGLLAACSQPAGGAGGFSLSLEPTSVTVAAGGSTTVRLDVGSEGGFSGEVSLALEGLAGATVSPARVQVPGGPYTLTLAVDDSVAPGSYDLALVGASGSLMGRATFTLAVTDATPDFELALSAVDLAADPGGSVGTALTVTPSGGFAGTLTLSLVDASDAPAAGFTLVPASLYVSGIVQQPLSIQVAGDVGPGTYPLRLKVTGDGVTHYADLAVTVSGLELALTSTELYAPQGGTATATLLVNAVGVSGDLALALASADGGPAPTGLALQPSSVAVPGGPYALSLSVDAGVATGSYDLLLKGTLGSFERSVAFTLTVQPPPEFTTSVSPDALTVEVGSSGTLYLELTFQADFNGDIGFALELADGSAAPAGLALDPTVVSMAANSGDTNYVALDLAVADTMAPGTYALRVRASSSNTTQYAGFSLTVPVPPDFTLSLDPTIADVVAGGSTTVRLDAVPHNGFAGVVQLSLVDSSNGAAPSGMTLEPTSVDLSGGAVSQTLTLRVDEGVLVDRYHLQVVGSGGGTTQTANLSLSVQDFSLSFGTTTPSLAADQGGSATTTLTVQVSQPDTYSTFPGPVALELATQDGSPLPPGLTLSPVSVDLSSGYVNVNLTVTADASTPPGSYALMVIGRAGGTARAAAFGLNVRGFDVALGASELAFWTEGSGDLGLTLTPGGGFDGTVSLSLEAQDGSAAPAGLTLSPSSVSVSSTTSVTLSVAADASVAAGVYPLRLKAVSGSIVHYADFTLKVGDFDLALDASSLAVWQNDRSGFGVTVTPSGGFAGTVNLYLAPQVGATGPTGVSLDPSALDVSGGVSQTVNVVAADAASPGSFAMQLEARAYLGGVARSRTVPFTLEVKGFLVELSEDNYFEARGGSASGQLTLTAYGLNDVVALALLDPSGAAPAGIALAPASVAASDGAGTHTITIGTDANVDYDRTYGLDLVATWGSLERRLAINLTVYRLTEYWVPRDPGTDYDLWGVAYGEVNGSGLFVAVGGGQLSLNGSSYGVAATSTDGASWSLTEDISSNPLLGIGYGGGTFVAVGRACEIVTYDGTGWTTRANPDAYCSANLNDVAYSGTRFVAVGDSGTVLWSNDGASWSSATSGVSGDLYAITYGNGTFVAVGAGGTVLTSTDGLSWSAQASGTTADLSGIAYGDGTFVAVGAGGTVLTSTDGASWSLGDLGTSGDATGVAYGYDWDNVGVFVVTTNEPNTGIHTSSDAGSSWSSQSSGGLGDALEAAGYGDHVFVVVGQLGALGTSP